VLSASKIHIIIIIIIITTATWLVFFDLIILSILHQTMAYGSSVHDNLRLSLAEILILPQIISEALPNFCHHKTVVIITTCCPE
jgi:hypothetical protein